MNKELAKQLAGMKNIYLTAAGKEALKEILLRTQKVGN